MATGHLYERLLKIMMLSVIKTTKTPVKFWILKNFLSPSLKDFIPEYAKRYGFQVRKFRDASHAHAVRVTSIGFNHAQLS